MVQIGEMVMMLKRVLEKHIMLLYVAEEVVI